MYGFHPAAIANSCDAHKTGEDVREEVGPRNPGRDDSLKHGPSSFWLHVELVAGNAKCNPRERMPPGALAPFAAAGARDWCFVEKCEPGSVNTQGFAHAALVLLCSSPLSQCAVSERRPRRDRRRESAPLNVFRRRNAPSFLLVEGECGGREGRWKVGPRTISHGAVAAWAAVVGVEGAERLSSTALPCLAAQHAFHHDI